MASPTMNGPTSHSGRYIDTIDTDDPEYQRQMRRPAEVKEDLTQMDNRSRVKLILNSQAFREELEQIIETQLSDGNNPTSLLALQQITDLLLPHTRAYGAMSAGHSASVIPVNDIRGVESLNYHKLEKQMRCKLASLYRVVDMHGWTHSIYNHITARIDQDREHFLINPFGLLYSEVTAASLIKVDMQGQIVDSGSTPFSINLAGFTLHSAIHAARPDIKCVIHLHTPSVVAVSAMGCGLLPTSQEAMICGHVTYHDYNGILIDDAEREHLARNLGPSSMVLVLRNHGVAIGGRTIEEAFHFTFNFMAACENQLRMMAAGLDNITIPSEEIQQKVFEIGSRGGGGVDQTGRKWRVGELEFEAIMRQFDNAGFRTGYTYHLPLVKYEKKDRSNSEVEIPPSASSFSHDDDVCRVMSPLKMALERQKQQYRAGWLNSPNTYMKKEIDEIGTDTPKKITKWVPDDSDQSGSASVKLDKPNVFAPQGENPKEYREKQKQIRKDYYEEKINAGPQSRILEGVTYEEAERMRDGNLSGTADTVVVVGAASKGIIQRDHQHNVAMYKTTYASNPFENISEDDLRTYQREVEGVTVTESDDLSPGPDGRLISTDERMLNIQQSTRIEGGDAPECTEINEPVVLEVVNGEPDFVDMAPLEERQPKAPHKSHEMRVNHGPQEVPRQTRETRIDDPGSYTPREHSRPPEVAPRRQRAAARDPRARYSEALPRQYEGEALSARQRGRQSLGSHPDDDVSINRTESARYPERSKELIDELHQRNLSRSHSDRHPHDNKPSSPTKSTDSASAADTLDDHSSKEGSPTKEQAPVAKEKAKKKKKFRIPSFSKKKKEKEPKESKSDVKE